MNFASLAEFLSMGGHGLYVWLSYAAAVAVVAYNVLSVRRANRQFVATAAARRRRAAATANRSGTGHVDPAGQD